MFLASILAALPMMLTTEEMLLQANKMFPDGVVHDFGKVPKGMQTKHTFRVVNTFMVPLHIVSLRWS